MFLCWFSYSVYTKFSPLHVLMSVAGFSKKSSCCILWIMKTFLKFKDTRVGKVTSVFWRNMRVPADWKRSYWKRQMNRPLICSFRSFSGFVFASTLRRAWSFFRKMACQVFPSSLFATFCYLLISGARCRFSNFRMSLRNRINARTKSFQRTSRAFLPIFVTSSCCSARSWISLIAEMLQRYENAALLGQRGKYLLTAVNLIKRNNLFPLYFYERGKVAWETLSWPLSRIKA